ncbi:hypothetical protein U1Q18_007215, partial [Sarracenia purpurea var. burkii]
MERSSEYYSEFAKMERMPTVTEGVPQYPNAHLTFNKTVSYEEDGRSRPHNHHHHHEPRVHQKVQFVEETTEIHKDDGITSEVYEKKTVDEEAGGFIQEQKRKNFELYKSDAYR